ncbi:hypothetical protein J1G44_14220 [Cellulomonas sp. zg-ZUI199]|uniref:Integral membrane protein n=1 Tax=Cellulomonas wangleii TaxID=2816956 RepID=A0ABX8D0F3_9CELL|nr:hypothetical protein [Cellulomonas wangleii]MBO0925631.1 hypothetical protein [Cellulomonas wangleii]QVI60915.1 hypothetical protein KG103_10205 [Cellulomonas wangleii]
MPETLYGRVLRALQDPTLCPGCAATLSAGRCGACALDVSGPDGTLVWQDSQAVVRALRARQDRVAALRAAQLRTATGRGSARAALPDVPPSPRPAPAAPAPAVRARAVPTAATTPAVPRAVRPPVPPAAPRRPWRVQTVLQVVGAALLVAASIAFLVFAWDVMGLGGRALVVAVGTVVVFGLASWLRARSLPQGAEAVGAVAVVLLLLDAWAVRATGTLVVGDAATQAGLSALVCAGLLTAWGVRSRLRVGAVAGAVLVPLTPLPWLLTAPDAATAAALLLLAAASTAVRAVAPWVHSRAERAVLHGAAAGLLPAAAVTALVGTVTSPAGTAWPAVAVLAGVAAVSALQVVVEARGAVAPPPGTRSGVGPRTARASARAAWAWAGGVTTALALAAAFATAVVGVTGSTRATDAVLASLAGVVGTCVAAAGLLRVDPVVPVAWRADVRAGARAALAATAPAASWSAAVLVTAATTHLLRDPAPGSVPPVGAAAVGALAGAGALGVLVARWEEGTVARAAALAWRAVVVGIAVVVPVLTAVGPAAPVVAVGAHGAVAAVLLTPPTARRLGRASVRTGAVAAGVLAVLGALPHPGWTAAALLVPAAIAVHARTWSATARSGAASTATAALLLVAAGTTAGTAAGLPVAAALALAVTAVAAVLLVLAHRLGTGAAAERDTALGLAGVTVAVSWASATAQAAAAHGSGPSALSVLVTAAPLAAAAAAVALVVVLLHDDRRWGADHMTAGAGAAAPVTALVVATAHLTLGRPGATGTALLVTLVGAVAWAAAAPAGLRGAPAARVAVEAAGTAVVAGGLAAAAVQGQVPLAVALVLAAVGAAAWALGPGRSRVWWLALVLATCAWWAVLGVRDATVVEVWTLPPALVVAGVGAWRVARDRPGAAGLLVAGLASATLPTALLPAVLEVGTRWVDRGLLTAGVTVAVTAAAVLVAPRRPAAGELLGGLAALLLLVGPITRAVVAAVAPDAVVSGPWLPDGTVAVEVWSWPAAAALLLCAGTSRTPRVRAVVDTAAPWAVVLTASAPTVLAALAAPAGPAATVRALALGAAAVALALGGGVSGQRLRAPLSRPRAAGPAGDTSAGGAGAGLAGLGLLLLAGATATVTAVLVARAPGVGVPPLADLPLAAAGLVTLATAALTARRGDVPRVWVAAGLLALVPSVLLRTPDARPVVWWATAAALLGLSLVARSRRGSSPGAADPQLAPVDPQGPVRSAGGLLAARYVAPVLTGAALVVATVGPWAEALVHRPGPVGPPLLAVEGVAVLTFGVGLAHRRTGPGRRADAVLRCLLVGLLALPTLVAVDATALGTARGIVVLGAGAALAWWARDRVGTVLGVTTATLATTVLALRGGPEPADVPWTVLGLLTLALGVQRLRRDPAQGSWAHLGVPLALTLGAPLTLLVAEPAGWRATLLLALGVASVVTGATRRRQAPFLLGAGAVLVTLVVVLSPIAAGALAAIDGWILLAVGGTLVLGLGVTYEKRVQEAREAVRFVGEMR